MDKVPFGIRFTVNDYAVGELEVMDECADDLLEEEQLFGGEEASPAGLKDRYKDFLQKLRGKEVKPSTMVDRDVLEVFSDDLYNKALIDYIEGNWDHCPNVVKGGEMFLGRYNKLKEVHGIVSPLERGVPREK